MYVCVCVCVSVCVYIQFIYIQNYSTSERPHVKGPHFSEYANFSQLLREDSINRLEQQEMILLRVFEYLGIKFE